MNKTKPNKLLILIEGNIYQNIINTYKKCKNIPIFWKKIFIKIANYRDYVYISCNSPRNSFHQHFRDWYFFNLMKSNAEIDYDNDFNNDIFDDND